MSIHPRRVAAISIYGLLVALLCAAIAGCPATGPSVRSNEPSPPSESVVEVVDRLGREVDFAKPPSRVISLSPSATELMFAIGAGEAIVGATQHCDYPEAALSIPRVGGGTIDSLSRETILSLDPDLVLCKWDSHEPLFELFDRLNIPYIAVGPESLAELFEEATMLGKVTGNTAQAETLIATMTARHERLTQRVADIPPQDRLTVFYEVWDDPLMTAGGDSFIGKVLADAGLKNIFADAELRFPQVSIEVVVDRNPQVILAPSSHADRTKVEKLMQRPGWEELQAVKDRRVYIVNGDQISRCGPRLLDALEQVIDTVYSHEAATQGSP